LTSAQRLWAVDLSTPGLHAMAGLTGMAMWGVAGFATEAVHLLVPRGGHVLPVAGVDVVVHESRRFTDDDVVHGRAPQLTTLARATVDAAVWTKDLWTAYRILVAPVQQRKVRAVALRHELLGAGFVRLRKQLIPFVHDLCGG